MESNNLISYLDVFFQKDCFERINSIIDPDSLQFKPAKEVYEDLRYYVSRFKTNKFEFNSYCNLNTGFLSKLCDLIINADFCIKWSSPAVFKKDFNEDNILQLKKSGCYRLVFDLFSASDNFLERMKIPFDSRVVINILQKCKEHGIDVGIRLLFYHPQSDITDFDNTLEFIRLNSEYIKEISCVDLCISSFLRQPRCRNFYSCKGDSNNNYSSLAKRIMKPYRIIKDLGIPAVVFSPSEQQFDLINSFFTRHVICNRNLSLVFDGGCCHIFWKNMRLTKGFGIYTSIFALGNWQDSRQVDWKFVCKDNSSIVVVGNWKFLPIVQQWRIEMFAENKISFCVTMEIKDGIIIDGEQQFNVMLDSVYKSWFFSKDLSNIFPEFFNKEWVNLFEKTIEHADCIGVEANSEKFPDLRLRCDFFHGRKLAVLNTPLEFSSRKLKAYFFDMNKKPPGEIVYFKGEILIGK